MVEWLYVSESRTMTSGHQNASLLYLVLAVVIEEKETFGSAERFLTSTAIVHWCQRSCCETQRRWLCQSESLSSWKNVALDQPYRTLKKTQVDYSSRRLPVNRVDDVIITSRGCLAVVQSFRQTKTFRPVSYTHLDVYKRQIHAMTRLVVYCSNMVT